MTATSAAAGPGFTRGTGGDAVPAYAAKPAVVPTAMTSDQPERGTTVRKQCLLGRHGSRRSPPKSIAADRIAVQPRARIIPRLKHAVALKPRRLSPSSDRFWLFGRFWCVLAAPARPQARRTEWRLR